jgi:hypothetical protein
MLNWKPYDRHDWKNCDQKKFTARQKKQFEELAAQILRLPKGTPPDCWGTVHPPGRNATVIQIHPGVRHRFEQSGRRAAGLKIFNLVDGQVMWPSVSKFHESQRRRLPGLPNSHVQEVQDCGEAEDSQRRKRGYLVQPWVAGTVLAEKIQQGMSASEALQIAGDLFNEIVIPLWGVGTSWWDVRDSNYVVTPADRLMMIDSDTVGAYADEMLATPPVFARRNRGSRLAMQRYAALLARMAARLAPRGEKSRWTLQARAFFKQHLAPVFVAPYPLPPGWKQAAREAWGKFRADYQSLLQPPAVRPAPPK